MFLIWLACCRPVRMNSTEDDSGRFIKALRLDPALRSKHVETLDALHAYATRRGLDQQLVPIVWQKYQVWLSKYGRAAK